MSKILRVVLVACVCQLGAVWLVHAQTPPPAAPTLSDAQKLQVQVLAQRMEIAQLKAQLAQSDFDRAQGDARALLASWQLPGYELDPQTLVYKKAGSSTPKH